MSVAAFDPRRADPRPGLILVAVDMGRHLGTEPGRAWAWACGLARHYRLHIVAAPAIAERCRAEPAAADWTWHLTRVPQPASHGLAYYRDYARWCADVPRVVRAVVAEHRPVGLHHSTLGSFRVLPRYDRCGVRYTLGPLGGGEATPRALLRSARLPLRPRLAELVRPWLNNAMALVPGACRVVRHSALALGTTVDSERILQQMGARNTGVAFPDYLPADVDPSQAAPVAQRAAELRTRVRLIWSGRAVWWKAGQLAIELLRRLVAAGVDAELVFFSYGSALEAWRRQIAVAGLASRCRINSFVPRQELLAELGRAHAFVFPTLHDSANAALLEAYAMGLPSLTVGLGGPAVIATPQTGFNVRPENLDAWIDAAVRCIQGWRHDPAAWQAASEAARARALAFGPDHLQQLIEGWLPPAVFTS